MQWNTDLILAILTTLISFAALLISGIGYVKNETHVKKSIRPYLWLDIVDLPDRIAIKLQNDGPGIAILKDVIFSLPDHPEREAYTDLLSLIETYFSNVPDSPLLDRSIWKRFLNRYPGIPVGSGMHRVLLELQLDRSRSNRALLNDLREALMNVEISLHYTDIYEKTVFTLDDNFRYLQRAYEFSR